jgi:hypothetical protein
MYLFHSAMNLVFIYKSKLLKLLLWKSILCYEIIVSVYEINCLWNLWCLEVVGCYMSLRTGAPHHLGMLFQKEVPYHLRVPLPYASLIKPTHPPDQCTPFHGLIHFTPCILTPTNSNSSWMCLNGRDDLPNAPMSSRENDPLLACSCPSFPTCSLVKPSLCLSSQGKWGVFPLGYAHHHHEPKVLLPMPIRHHSPIFLHTPCVHWITHLQVCQRSTHTQWMSLMDL